MHAANLREVLAVGIAVHPTIVSGNESRYTHHKALAVNGDITSAISLPQPYTTAPRHWRIFTIDFTDHAVGSMHTFGDGASCN
jgi:predicted solute-binding protein